MCLACAGAWHGVQARAEAGQKLRGPGRERVAVVAAGGAALQQGYLPGSFRADALRARRHDLTAVAQPLAELLCSSTKLIRLMQGEKGMGLCGQAISTGGHVSGNNMTLNEAQMDRFLAFRGMMVSSSLSIVASCLRPRFLRACSHATHPALQALAAAFIPG